MTSRERVSSPDELRGGDRVELVDEDNPIHVVFIDLLWWHVPLGEWCGLVSAVSDPSCITREGDQMQPGDLGTVGAAAYPAGCVFIRRRSREGLLRARNTVIRAGSFDALQRLLDAEATK